MIVIMLYLLVLSALAAAGDLVHTKAGQSATIKCGINNFINSLEWIRGSSFIVGVGGKNRMPRKGPGDIALRSKVMHDTNLVISGVKEGDAGEFVCKADNERQVHTLVVFTVWVDPPGSLQVGSHATLNCRVSGLPLDTVVQWRRPDSGHHLGSPVTLIPVKDFHRGIWKCVFSHDAAEYAEEIDIIVQGGTSPTRSEGLVPELAWWGMAAGGSVVVLLLLVLVLVLCLRIRRRKKHFLQMKNARKSLNSRQYCHCRCPPAAPAAAAPPPQKKMKPPALSAQKK
ncbi:hemicentin-2-like isoform X2 [Dunckerocampus dactyliophorus]|uniref:hemicentin-2-like isoform X2 n=1 Tax=Dunckerocampus dactyliophorus TaxID=161453 RepID=UPI00240570CD|nr:hemicentin-2-like isoform X2 [Dunckerocampus dactyliophorus]